jgi:hypothetical protein
MVTDNLLDMHLNVHHHHHYRHQASSISIYTRLNLANRHNVVDKDDDQYYNIVEITKS